jgi:hypothetical protein
MQTIICSVIIGMAIFFVANRWLPTKIKQRCLQLLGKQIADKPVSGACGSCSSCGNCGNNSTKLVKK